MNDHLEDETERDDAVIGVALRWSLLVIVLVAIGAALVLLRKKPEAAEEIITREPIAAPQELDQSSLARPQVNFSAVSLPFKHQNGATGEKLLPECMGSGVAVLDYDNDGHMDLLFVNQANWPHDPAPADGGLRLFRNDGTGHFTDVSQKAGLGQRFYGMGVAAGDLDNDGDTDLFVTALGPNHLFLNNGGVFSEVDHAGGAAGGDTDWHTSAGFFDYDNDGDLDLFACNYVAWSREKDMKLNFSLNGTDRAYGPPTSYEGVHSNLFRNDGGRFTDISAMAGIQINNPATGKPLGKALAVTFADVDGDGYDDILVACDTVQNFVFRNLGSGSFEEMGVMSGMAFDTMGKATAGMGVDAADVSGDGRLSIGIGNFAGESTSLYVQQPSDPWLFADMSASRGVGSPSRLKLSFGLMFLDYDLDGRLDMLQANGHLEDEINEVQPSQHYRQAAQLFWNAGDRGFLVVPESEGGDLSRPIVGRSTAYGDFDGDGDLDLVVTQVADEPLLLRNESDLGHHWLRIRLKGAASNKDGFGAKVILKAGGLTQSRHHTTTRAYLSQVEPVITFGLGKVNKVDSLEVIWPSGQRQMVDVPEVDGLIQINEPEY